MQSDSQTSSRAGVFRKAAPQSCLIESFNNAPLFNFKGVASGAETLGQNQKTVERYDSATLNNSKKLCLVQYSKKKCLYRDMHVEAQLQAHKHAPAPEYYQ